MNGLICASYCSVVQDASWRTEVQIAMRTVRRFTGECLVIRASHHMWTASMQKEEILLVG